jgi:hypothetical protein
MMEAFLTLAGKRALVTSGTKGAGAATVPVTGAVAAASGVKVGVGRTTCAAGVVACAAAVSVTTVAAVVAVVAAAGAAGSVGDAPGASACPPPQPATISPTNNGSTRMTKRTMNDSLL